MFNGLKDNEALKRVAQGWADTYEVSAEKLLDAYIGMLEGNLAEDMKGLARELGEESNE